MTTARSNIIFVAATDTNVGKTTVTAELLRSLLQAGLNVRPLKVFSSGGREDAIALRQAVMSRWTVDAINPYFFQAAVTPLLAAEMEGRKIPLAECLHTIREAADGVDLLLVEGAGGLMSPLGDSYDIRELILQTGGRTILVAANRIGVINQVGMALSVLEVAGIGADSIVLSNCSEELDSTMDSNLPLLQRLYPGQLFDEMPHANRATPGEARVKFLKKTLATLQCRT